MTVLVALLNIIKTFVVVMRKRRNFLSVGPLFIMRIQFFITVMHYLADVIHVERSEHVIQGSCV